MATTIHLNFGDFAFSSAVERINVRSTAASVDISLYTLSGTLETLIFSETYYPYGGNVSLHDFSSIIESEMSASGSPMQRYKLVAHAADNSSDTKTFTVLYCDRHVEGLQPGGIIFDRFLTSRRIITTTRDIPVPLFYVRPPMQFTDQELIAYHITCRDRANGSVRVVFSAQGYTGYGQDIELSMLTVNHAALRSICANNYSRSEFDVLGVTIDIGKRSITIYYTDQRPDLRLWFRNMFNCPELAELTGDTTAKTKLKRSETVCAGRIALYDLSAEQSYEFQADGLTADTANWLSELFTSHDVRIVNRPYSEEDYLDEMFPSVLITDCTSEVQDGDDELNKIKFTYRHTSDRPDSGLTRYDRIHTDQYKNPFN